MPTARSRIATAAAGLALAACVGFVPSTPAQADPDIQTVQARVDRLFREAEQASERYNEAKLTLTSLRKGLGSLRADERRQDRALDDVRADVRDAILEQSASGDIDPLTQILAGQDGGLVSDLSAVTTVNQIQSGLLDDYNTGMKALRLRHSATLKRLEQVDRAKAALAQEKRTIDTKLAAAKQLLGELKEKERLEILSRGGARIPSDVPATGRAAAAIRYAMAQVGKAYVYGAAGPNAFDCSGLMMRAWGTVGVSLPHSSAAQYAGGRKIPASDLQPGDLVFYYHPISHVGMYIGNGLIVEAANPGAGVRVSGVYSMPYSGAVRPG